MLSEANEDGGGGAVASNQVGDEDEGLLVQMVSRDILGNLVEVEEEGNKTWILEARNPGLNPSSHFLAM